MPTSKQNKKLISKAVKKYIEMVKYLVDKEIEPEFIERILYDAKMHNKSFETWSDARRLLDCIVYYGYKTKKERLDIAEMFGIKLK